MDAIELAREWQNRFDEVLAIVNEDPAAAMASAKNFLAATDKLNHYTELRTYLGIGHILRAAGNNRMAGFIYEAVVNSSGDDPVLKSQAARNLADIWSETGGSDDALDLLRDAAELARMGPVAELGKVYTKYGFAYRRLCEYRSSLEWFVKAFDCFDPKEEYHGVAAHNVMMATVSLAMADPRSSRAADIGKAVLLTSKSIRTSSHYGVYCHWLSATAHIVSGYPKPAASILPRTRAGLKKRGAPRNLLALTEIDEAQAYHKLEYPVYRREALHRAAAYYRSDHPSHKGLAEAADSDVEPWEIRHLGYAPASQPSLPEPSPILETILPRIRAKLPGILWGMLGK